MNPAVSFVGTSEVLMIIALLVGLTLGYVLAIMPGPVGVTAIKLSLDQGRKPGSLLAFGNGVIDAIFAAMAIFTASAALQALNAFSDEHPVLILSIQIAIVVGIFIWGLLNLKAKQGEDLFNSSDTNKLGRFFGMLAVKGPFFLGVAIALTNIANPTYMPFLIGLTGTVVKLSMFEHHALNLLAFSLGFGLGNTLWLLTLVRLIVRFKHKFSPAAIEKINKFAGFTLIGFSTILGYRILTITEWSHIIRMVFAF